MTSNKNINDDVRPMGLVPLYPFPSLHNPSKSLIPQQSSQLTSFGSFLPPIFNSFYYGSLNEEMASIEADRILAEAVTEEVRIACIL